MEFNCFRLLSHRTTTHGGFAVILLGLHRIADIKQRKKTKQEQKHNKETRGEEEEEMAEPEKRTRTGNEY